MSNIKERIYNQLPNVLQNLGITLFDIYQYRKRKSGKYSYYFEFYKNSRKYTVKELKEIQLQLLRDFIIFSKKKSKYYKIKLPELESRSGLLIEDYKKIPIQTKEDIRSNILEVYTVSKVESILSKTGGTTGKSLELRFTHDDIQNRFALLDSWRAEYGYKLGNKVGWFSGKTLLTSRDIKNHRYWKYDYIYRKRYYSTFHINQNTIKFYIDDLNNFKPLFIVGFPSSIHEIAKWGLENNYLLKYKLETIFPTAETIVDSEKEVIEKFFGGRVVNQYASSEGAPFILECKRGKLHMELLSGYFEVLDDRGNSVEEGELVFTSFTTHGTPLIRYAIQDTIVLSNEVCSCGNNNPLVKSITGRTNDFIYSKERGKINLGNVSNCIKYVNGVVKFQIIQVKENHIDVYIIKSAEYTFKDENLFKKELEQRLGTNVTIKFYYVDNIPKESSGKYRIVKQYLTFS